MGAPRNGKRGRGILLGLGALVAFALWAVPAQALEWLPGKTAILGKANNAEFKYSKLATEWCDGEIGGTTGTSSALITVTSMTFKACESAQPAEVTTNAGTTNFWLTATKATGGGSGTAHIEIPTGGNLNLIFKSGGFVWCEFIAKGPQTLASTFDSTQDYLTMNATLTFERGGGFGSEAACGPKKSTGTFTGDYLMLPNNLEIK